MQTCPTFAISSLCMYYSPRFPCSLQSPVHLFWPCECQCSIYIVFVRFIKDSLVFSLLGSSSSLNVLLSLSIMAVKIKQNTNVKNNNKNGNGLYYRMLYNMVLIHLFIQTLIQRRLFSIPTLYMQHFYL